MNVQRTYWGGLPACFVPRLLNATQDSDLFVRAAARLKKKNGGC